MSLTVTLALFTLSMPITLPMRQNAVADDLEEAFELASWFIPVTRAPKLLSWLGKSLSLRRAVPKAPKVPTPKAQSSSKGSLLDLSRHEKGKYAVEVAKKSLRGKGDKVLGEQVKFQGRTAEKNRYTICDLVVAERSGTISCVEVKFSKDKKFSFTENQRYYHQQDSVVGSFGGSNANGLRHFSPGKPLRVVMRQMCYSGEVTAPVKCKI